jgi:ABC-2 type transport system ATP-binding protein
MSIAIETAALGRRFEGLDAVRDLTLSVAGGEFFGLVGPDGAGKSTAIRLLCTLLAPTAGHGQVLGLDLRRDAHAIKARIGYLSQSFTLYGDLSVVENLAFFADLHGVADYRRRRDELLEFTRLAEFRSRPAHALSGGMKKKLALACALIHTPEVLFLDEPSTGVDPVSRGEFWNILSGILTQGATLVMSTPYLDEAERCHRVGLMYRGTLIRTGTPAAIRRELPGRMFAIKGHRLADAYRVMRERWPATALVRYGDRLHFRVTGGEDEMATAETWLRQQGFAEISFTPIDPSLEDVFVALMNSPVLGVRS